jgi:hypothetical protein
MVVMATFSNLAQLFQTMGVVDFLLPFLLVFTIVYAVATKMPLFKDNKNFSLVIALTLGLLFVVPHLTGNYPLGYDPVDVMNNALPSISLISVAAIMLLLLMGIFGTNFAAAAAPLIAVVSIGFVAYVFGASLGLWTGPYDVFGWWSSEVTELLIIILVFGLIVWFIVRDPDKDKSKGAGMMKEFGKLFEKKW